MNDLIRDTEALFADLQSELQLFCTNTGIETPKAASLDGPYTRLSFCSTLNEQIAAKIPNFVLPDLSSPTAAEDLQSVYHQMNISLPSNLALPQLLDDLCKRFIEPLCEKPTWVIHHPAVLSPLAKSFTADDGQQVSARAELFVNGQEIVNCYEEENNPLEQRKKFLQQQEFHNRADDDEVPIGASSGFTSGIDESYIEALEWGMPPTGGWGCGVDRLVMLLTGASNIKDTLPFGNLRNVAAMGKPWRT